MTAATYTPRAGSVAYRVVDFLQRNPGEYLTRGDIATKFDCSASSIEMLLGDAMRSSLLTRTRSEEGEQIWRLGSRRVTLEGVVSALPPAPAARAAAPDPSLIQVRKGVRLKTPEELLQEKFAMLFETFDVGDSAEFDEDWYAALNDQLKLFRRTHKGWKFVFMATEPGKMGVERRK